MIRRVGLMLLVVIPVCAGTAVGSPRDQIEGVIDSLCAPRMEGRVVGSSGIDAAAQFIVNQLRTSGLEPAGDDQGWYQEFIPAGPLIADAVILPDGAAWGSMKVRNIIGRIPGETEGSVILGAHYDHLGRNEDGEIMPGADDNASGVAVMLAVAAELAREAPLHRAVLFVAFSGEEVGLLGSRWYVDHPALPLEHTIAMINLDTVGRMEERRLFIFSTETAAEFPRMFNGINLGFGFDLSMSRKAPVASDHIVFAEKGIPAVHFFTGPNADYHRPGDLPEKINLDEVAEIASFTAEAVRFLSDRDRDLTFLPPGAEKLEAPKSEGPRSKRRVSLGSIPDFNDEGEGVLLSGVLPGSPAEKVGLRKGDRVVSVDDGKIGNLEDYSIALKSYDPGDTIRIGFIRDGAILEVSATLVERR